LELEYQDCINTKTFERGLFYSLNTSENDLAESVSVFDSIKTFENYLQDKGYLSKINKEEYLSLASKIDETDFLKKEFKKFNSDNYFIKDNLMTSLFFEELLHDCFLSAFRNQIYYEKQFLIYDKVFLNSYPNSEILTELTNQIDFKSETQRLLLTFMIYSNRFWKFEMEEKPVANTVYN
jgi:hypothetical protein